MYAFLSQVFDCGNTAIEKRAIVYKRLLPLLDFGRDREGVDLPKVVLTHHRLKDLFEGELTDDDKLVYVNNVLKGKLLESDILVQQAMNNSKGQFANSPDLASELMNAIMDAFAAHGTMRRQALDSEKVRARLKDILLGPAQLFLLAPRRGRRGRAVGSAKVPAFTTSCCRLPRTPPAPKHEKTGQRRQRPV